MTDLISRQAAKDAFMKATADGDKVEFCWWVLEKLPTIDAVPVVRCKECKYNYGKEHGGEFNPEDIVCDYWATDGLNADDFCSYGERSEDGET